MYKAKFGLSKDKGIHILSLPLIAAELSILVPVKEIDRDGWGRTCQAMQRGGSSGRSIWACEGWESSEGWCGGFFCSPGWPPQVCFVRLEWVHGGPHLIDSTRETHILAFKSTPFTKLPLFLMFPKQEQQECPCRPRPNRHGQPGCAAAPSSSDSISKPRRGQANAACAD